MTRWLCKRWMWAALAGATVTVGMAAGSGAPPKVGDVISLKFHGQPDKQVKILSSEKQSDGSYFTEVKDVRSGETFTLVDKPGDYPPARTGAAPVAGAKANTAPPRARPRTNDPLLPPVAAAMSDPIDDKDGDGDRRPILGRIFGNRDKDESPPAAMPSGAKAEAAEPDRKPGLLGRIFGSKKTPEPAMPSAYGASKPSTSAPPPVLPVPPGGLKSGKPAFPPSTTGSTPPSRFPNTTTGEPPLVSSPSPVKPPAPSVPAPVKPAPAPTFPEPPPLAIPQPPGPPTATPIVPPMPPMPLPPAGAPKPTPMPPVAAPEVPSVPMPLPPVAAPEVPSAPPVAAPALPAIPAAPVEPPAPPLSIPPLPAPAVKTPSVPMPVAPALPATPTAPAIPAPAPTPALPSIPALPNPVPAPNVPPPSAGSGLPAIPVPPGGTSAAKPLQVVLPAGFVPAPVAFDREVQPFVIALQSMSAPSARLTAAKGLADGRHGSTDGVKGVLFQAATMDPCGEVRAACITHLCELGYFTPQFLGYISAASDDADPHVREAAKAACAKMIRK